MWRWLGWEGDPWEKKKKKEKKIDIHPDHKSELSQRWWGGEIIIGLVLDYVLGKADTSAACKCVWRCRESPASPRTHTHTRPCTLDRRAWRDPLIEMHWRCSRVAAPHPPRAGVPVRPRLGTDQHVCTTGYEVSASSVRRQGAFPAALDLEDDK